MSYLTQNADKIIADIKNNLGILRHFNLLFLASQGNLDPLFEDRLTILKDAKAKKEFKQHKELPNYFKYAVDKLSQIYNFDVDRKISKDQTEVEKILKYVSFKEVMHSANRLCNTTNACLVEIYHTKKRQLKVRALPNDRFWVWTDDNTDPTVPTVYVKMIKQLDIPVEMANQGFTDNTLYHLYTDEEDLQWSYATNSNPQKSVGKSANPTSSTANVLGFAPFFYISYDKFNLIPEKDTASESLAIGPGFDVTKVNVAAWHMAHPLRVFYNVDPKKSEIYAGYDGAILLNKSEVSGSEAPKLEQIPPALPIKEMQDWIKSKIEDYFHTKNVPFKSNGAMDKSALAMLISGADTLEARKTQMIYFRPADEQIVSMIIKYHNWLVGEKVADLPADYPVKKLLSKDITVTTEFSLPSSEAEQVKEADGEKIKVAQEVPKGDKQVESSSAESKS